MTNTTTSKTVAAIAGRVLRVTDDQYYQDTDNVILQLPDGVELFLCSLEELKSLAASALAQSSNHKPK